MIAYQRRWDRLVQMTMLSSDGSAPSVPETLAELREPVPVEENLMFGVMAGVAAMLVGTAIWVGITVATNYQIGYMAVGVGFLVGLAMRKIGRGQTKRFQVVGATLSLLGCALGNLFTGCELIALENEVSFWAVAGSLNVELVEAIMTAMFSPMDLLFYVLGAMAGWKYSVAATD